MDAETIVGAVQFDYFQSVYQNELSRNPPKIRPFRRLESL